MTIKGNAFVLGATGQIGRAAVRALVADGWEVTAASRRGGRDEGWPAEVRSVAVDRTEEGALAAALGAGTDVLVDVVAYDAGHGRQLTGLAGRIGSAVVISSAAVYQDAQGRGFDTQDEPDGFPDYPLPVPETLGTVAPGDTTYSTRKVALERELLAAGDALPTTLLRAAAVHGPYSPGPRELWFVKRALDGRPVRILAEGGRSVFHPAHVDNIAELVRLAAARPGSRVLNAADPEAPTVAEIGAAIDAAMGVRSETVLFEGPPAKADMVGYTPWTTPRPMVCAMAAAERELGYRPVTGYAASLPGTIEFLAAAVAGRDWREVFPGLARYGVDFFDYAAEDAWLAAR
ncbi:NAD-dependent epimerase/dehydratase family protein [Streptomyces sp. NPDC048659]|uniref:NAD-dependent epimerase/dehydratase family protein n=1 Tax=Streptomyces sp. NPDC048659 TaxID=3155489 RepID=UPI0034268722